MRTAIFVSVPSATWFVRGAFWDHTDLAGILSFNQGYGSSERSSSRVAVKEPSYKLNDLLSGPKPV